MYESKERFRIGNGVSHPKHGVGVVRAYADHSAYLVRFNEQARLTKVEGAELTSVPSQGEYVRCPRK